METHIVFKIGGKHWNYTLHFFLTCWGTKYSDAPAWIIYWGEMEEFIFISPHLYCEGNEINSSISSQLMGGKWKSLISFPPTSCRGNGELIFISSHLYCEEMKSKSSFPLQEVGENECKLFHLPPIIWEEMEELCFISLTVEVFEKIYYVDVNGQHSQAVRASFSLYENLFMGNPPEVLSAWATATNWPGVESCSDL